MVIEAAGGQLTKDKSEVTAETIVLAGEKDYDSFKKSKKPWAPAKEFQEKDFVKFSILKHTLDRASFKW